MAPLDGSQTERPPAPVRSLAWGEREPERQRRGVLSSDHQVCNRSWGDGHRPQTASFDAGAIGVRGSVRPTR